MDERPSWSSLECGAAAHGGSLRTADFPEQHTDGQEEKKQEKKTEKKTKRSMWAWSCRRKRRPWDSPL